LAKEPNVLKTFFEVPWDIRVKYAPPSPAKSFQINSSQTILSPVATKPTHLKIEKRFNQYVCGVSKRLSSPQTFNTDLRKRR
jgi:hypothetical protein